MAEGATIIMAKVLGTTQGGLLIEVTKQEAKKISANSNIKEGDEFNVSSVYHKVEWIGNNKPKLNKLSDDLRTMADGLDNAITVSEI
jgi:hypothetical protein